MIAPFTGVLGRSARYAAMVLLGSALLIAQGRPSSAQPVDVPPTWGGDFWSRPRLTGSWWGLRDELGKKGVVFDTDLLLTPQGVLSGGKDTTAKFWGNADYTLNVDTGKLGLWPGGFFKISADSGFGDSVLGDSGALLPVNTAALLPRPNDPTTALMHATFTQFLSPKLGVFAGKIFTLDAGAGEFAGDYRTQFMNTGLVIPATLALVPISAFGGGVVVLPWENVVLSALALDPSGTPTNNDVSEAFEDGVTVLASAKVTIKPFGLVGHQSVGGMWSNKERVSLIQDPSNIATFLLAERFPRLQDPGPLLRRILERFFPQLLVPVKPAKRENSTWAMFYGFDQYVWQPAGDPTRGIGIFFSFGASDGEANPVKYSYSMGIGGKGVVPGRPFDTFGIGWARTQFSDNLVPFLRQTLDLGLDHEDAIEMYYNASITRWLNVSLDLQVVNPGLKKTLSSSGNLKDVDTAVVAGLRMYVRF
jgi:porin